MGACCALRPDDYITNTHRGHGHLIAKGASLVRPGTEQLISTLRALLRRPGPSPDARWAGDPEETRGARAEVSYANTQVWPQNGGESQDPQAGAFRGDIARRESGQSFLLTGVERLLDVQRRIHARRLCQPPQPVHGTGSGHGSSR